MGRAIDILEFALSNTANDRDQMTSKELMMVIFKQLLDTLPEFQLYMNFMFEIKEAPTIVKNQSNLMELNSLKVLPYDLLRAELFYPNQDENKATDIICKSMAVELAQAILVELRDPKKATHNYLSSSDGKIQLW